MTEKSVEIVCDCGLREHQFALSFDDDDMQDFDYIILSVHLRTYKNFFGRLWHAVKYVFGYKSRYGCFDETLISFEDSLKIARLLTDYHTSYITANVDTFEKQIEVGAKLFDAESRIMTQDEYDSIYDDKYRQAMDLQEQLR